MLRTKVVYILWDLEKFQSFRCFKCLTKLLCICWLFYLGQKHLFKVKHHINTEECYTVVPDLGSLKSLKPAIPLCSLLAPPSPPPVPPLSKSLAEVPEVPEVCISRS